MAIFKCKMCGGDLEIAEGMSVAECQYCGTKQTLPKLDDEKRANLYDRANHFRRNNEFDKAMGIYEQILNEDGNDAEAYWSLVLCRYGIEYVEDPSTHKRVPTVNRAQYTSIFADADYKSAIEHADGYQKSVYEEEAKAIDEIQKGILAISSKEEPFDVFICYKETDNGGRRTPDSVLANELYHELTEEGFKVFFSRITLEDKLGSAYEPYIFAALNSAKVMVVLGTKAEYFNAAWVKNEWSRYLALIKGGAKKMLIPAYKDMDPYDLPEEFSHLQAQDMSKLGFMQDLIRGIKKIAQADEQPVAAVVNETVVTGSNANTAPLLERVFMFLADGDWQSADEYCEKVLDLEPKNAQAYLGKLMAELQVRQRSDLANCPGFWESKNYKNLKAFAEEKLASELSGYITYIQGKAEISRKNKIYASAEKVMSFNNTYDYEIAIQQFESIIDWKDSKEKIAECKRKIEELRAENERKAKRLKKIALIGLPIVVAVVVFLIVLNTVIIPNSKYNKAVALSNDSKYKEALAIFTELGDYKNSLNLANKCQWLSYQMGDIVRFGNYEQDNNASNGKEKIEWIVLDKQDGKLLLISKYVLINKPYNEKDTDTTWEECTLRTWLNREFLNNAFTSEEQEKILTTSVFPEKNPEYDIYPGNATEDKVFLLSIAEAEKYFNSIDVRRVAPTKYAIASGAYISKDSETASGGNTCSWWLRSPGHDRNFASMVYDFGSVNTYGFWVDLGRTVHDLLGTKLYDDMTGGVRPALWIDLEF